MESIKHGLESGKIEIDNSNIISKLNDFINFNEPLLN